MNIDDMTEEELDELASKGTNEDKRAVAVHPNTSLKTLRYLSQIGFFDEVDQNPLILLHIESGSAFDVAHILVNIADKTKRPERLEELASSNWVDVRRNVSWNDNAPPQCLVMLAKDENLDVRYGVARNRSTPPDTLSVLAKDQDDQVVLAVAKNVNTPLATLTLLTKHESRDVCDAAKTTLAKLQKASR